MNYLSVMLTLLVSLMTISSFSIISNEVLIEKYGNDIKNIFLKIPVNYYYLIIKKIIIKQIIKWNKIL